MKTKISIGLFALILVGLLLIYPRLPWSQRVQIIDTLLVNEWPSAFTARAHFRSDRSHYLLARDFLRANPDTAEIILPPIWIQDEKGTGLVSKCRDLNNRACEQIKNPKLHEALYATTGVVYHTQPEDSIVFFAGVVDWPPGTMNMAITEEAHIVPADMLCGAIKKIGDQGHCHTHLEDHWYLSYEWVSQEVLSSY